VSTSNIDRRLAEARAQLRRVQPRDLDAELGAGALVVDLRPEADRRAEGELPGAVVIERIHLEWRLDPTSDASIPGAAADRRVVLVCNEGYASSLAAADLRGLGLTDVTDVEGGYRAWRTHRRTGRSTLQVALALVGLLLAALLAGCSSEASTRAGGGGGGSTTTAAAVTVPVSIPKGTTLRVGDQLDYLKTALNVAGEDEGFDYDVEYAGFVGGPPMLQAFRGGSLDIGFIGSTPLIFAQAADQDVVAVAGWSTDKGLQGLVSVDGSIDSWKDLEGKKVAYQRGTAAEAALLQALDAAGVDPNDITTIDVPITQINATLESGAADAAVSTEPLISLYLADHPGAKVVARPEEITDRSSFLIADRTSLRDDAKTAALADYTSRLVRAFAYLNDHPGALAKAVFVDQYGLPQARADEIVAEGAGTAFFFPLPGEVERQQQALADLFVAAGQVPSELDVSSEFDGRLNDLVADVQAKATKGGGS
jgi:sulfonate transport system substrate-binding protein